uniref:Uncharacterized protein n=1 Tax=Ananas comosus var. bracteatus TaxID=296719 RepID=A0A6V7NP76_ANACO|nr:unnamed protein product [Ananas comosus var. bracteatus]
MGSSHSSSSSSQGRAATDEEEEEEEDDDKHVSAAAEAEAEAEGRALNHRAKEKVLEQEPEILPCRLGPLQRPPAAPAPSPSAATEVLLISPGECAAALRPDLVGGRWPAAALTARGERQARALAVFLKSQAVRFAAVHCSPLDRARATAAFVCRELDFPEDQIQMSDALIEMSQGQWEGCLRSEIYTPEMINLIEKAQPDFSAPSGESLRQVGFRIIEFLNRTVIRLPEKFSMRDTSVNHNEAKSFSRNSSTNSVQERDGPHWDLVYRLNRPSLQRKKSGKSRLQFVTSGDNETEDESSPREAYIGSPSITIGIFTHAIPIKCLLASLLDCSPTVSHRICVDDSSVTVLEHSLRTGWQIKRLNDTAHLRLL